MYPVTSRGRGVVCGGIGFEIDIYIGTGSVGSIRGGAGGSMRVCVAVRCGYGKCGYGQCVVSGGIVRGYGRCGMSEIIRDGQCGSSTFGNYAFNFIQRLTKYIAGRRVNLRANMCLFVEKFPNNASRKNRFHNEPENAVARRFKLLLRKHIKRP